MYKEYLYINSNVTLEMALLLFFWARPGPLVDFLGPGPARSNKFIFRPVWARKYKSFKNNSIQIIF